MVGGNPSKHTQTPQKCSIFRSGKKTHGFCWGFTHHFRRVSPSAFSSFHQCLARRARPWLDAGATILAPGRVIFNEPCRLDGGGCWGRCFDVDVEPKIVGKLPPNHPFLIAVFHYFHHPTIGGNTPLFLETLIFF